MIRVPKRAIRPHPVPTDSFRLGQTRNHLHVARARANILGIGDFEQADWQNHFAVKEAVPQMINRAKNALRTNPFSMHVFFKLRAGRRCSCWGKGETPDGYCVSCFQVGNVGGYEKYNTHTDMIEVTRPDLSMVNVLPDVKSGRVPIPLTLASKATRGAIEAPIKLTPNAGVLDLFKVYAFQPPGTKVSVFVRKTIESVWVPATFENVQARLQAGTIVIRVELLRDNIDADVPYLKAIRLRYQLQKGKTTVVFNIPIGEESFQLQDLGIWETFTSLSFFTDNTLKALKNEDWMHNPRDNRRFKIINAKLFNPTNTTVDWFVNARLLQNFDSVAEFPL